MTAPDTMSDMSLEEIRQRSDSLIENIGVLRFSIAKIEALEAALKRLKEATHDERVRLVQFAASAENLGKWDIAKEYRVRAENLSGAIKESEE
jgi:prefoldin subunit 5